MPSVDVAMVRSLRPAAWELVRNGVVRSVATTLTKRNIVTDTGNTVTDVQTAFSSWDNCMNASFCKWPVIAIIVVGSLIILSVVWCIVRCCCCGLSCCCSCFQCLKCCGNCCGCCDPPGGRKHNYLDKPFIPPHHEQSQGYRNLAPMQAHFPSTTPTKFEPQYAEFDVSKKGGEDALPRMPSWETAESKKVMVEGEEVEMSNLKKSPAHTQNNIRMNSPSPSPVGLMSMSHNRSDANLLGSSGEPWSNHSQQALLPNSLSPNYVQSNQGPYVAPTHGNNDKFGTNHQSAGFGLDDPYDDHNAVSGTNGYGHAGQQTPYGAPVYQPHDNVSYGVVGAAGSAGAMPLRNQSARPHHQPYGAPPPIGADMGLGGRRSPALAQGRSPYHQEQVRDQLAEMPAMPHEQGATREMAGSTPPEGYGLRRPPTGDNNGSSPRGGRPPYGMDSRAGNSPGLRQSPAPRGGHPHGHSPRGSPAARQDQGFGRPPPSPRDNVNRSYSPAPARQFTPVTERQYSPAPDRQRTPKPRPLAQPVQPPSNFFGQSPPHSPITNNAGFDFTSGYSRPQEYEDHVPLAQSPTTAAYPGQKTYQPR